MRDFYLLLNGIVALALITLSVVAFLSDKKTQINRAFLLFASSVGVWLIAASISNDVRLDGGTAIYAKYLVFLCSYFASYFILQFTAIIVDDKKIIRAVRKLSLPLVLIGALSATPLVVGGIVAQDDVYAVEFGPLVLLYAVALAAQLGGALAILHKGVRHTRGKKRVQIRSIYRAFAVAIPILLTTQFIIPAVTGFFEITDIGILAMVLPVVALYINVIRRGLFDLRTAALRTVTYVLVLACLTAVYYLLAYGISMLVFGGSNSANMSVSPIDVALALALAFLFQPLKRFFDRLTNRLFYKEMYDSEEFFTKLNYLTRSATSLHSLLRSSVELLSATFKSEMIGFFIYRNNSSLMTVGSKGVLKMPPDDARAFDGLREPLYVDDSQVPPHLRRIMISHQMSIAAPLYLNDRFIGLMCLGEHKASHYTPRDLRTLHVAAGEIAVGVQNMLAIQEIRDLNESLQQRIDIATKELRQGNAQLQRLDAAKDEFISMASHQLRTPLTSIKGYIDMILDGDAGEVTPTQRQFLTEAFISSERMVSLINDFLSVSRLQTGKFMIEKRPTDLAQLVKQELDSLKINAAGRGLSFEYTFDEGIPLLMLDEGKIRQVVMNFADNALYYSSAGTVITVSLTQEKGDVVFRVKDTGIGVPEAEQARLFTKFFRAANARKQRPDGTGVGLYLAKRVISGHGGDMVFSSVEGKGSTFGFRLPINRLRARDQADKLDN